MNQHWREDKEDFNKEKEQRETTLEIKVGKQWDNMKKLHTRYGSKLILPYDKNITFTLREIVRTYLSEGFGNVPTIWPFVTACLQI